MLLRPTVFLFVFLLSGPSRQTAFSQRPTPESTEPEVLSIFPLAGQRGQSWQAEVRGRGLDGAHAVWSDCRELQVSVRRVEAIILDSHDPKGAMSRKDQWEGQRVLLEIRADAAATIGAHKLRLIAARGVSKTFHLLVERVPVIRETETSQVAREAQHINWPVAVAGRVGKEGEVDYFGFSVSAGRELRFEVDSAGSGFDPELTLFEPSGSWFDQDGLTRLAYNDDASPRQASTAALTYRFNKSGRYVVAVGAFTGLGGPDLSYRLRIAEDEEKEKSVSSAMAAERTAGKRAHSDLPEWREREFGRSIGPDRLLELRTRAAAGGETHTSLAASGGASPIPGSGVAPGNSLAQIEQPLSLGAVLPVVREREPNDSEAQGLNIELPVIAAGTIEKPGDVDHYRIQVRAGQALAFEIETRGEGPPLFGPRLEVLHNNGQEVLNNVYQRIGGDGDDWLQSLEPKIVFTFDRGGEYLVRIRDLTSRNGSPEFFYCLLIRPQIPHVGDVEVKEDRLNLVAGEAKRLMVTIGQEEGFDGQIAVMIENLPAGVSVFPAADVPQPEGPPFPKVSPERFVPRMQSVTLVLLAGVDAPATPSPHWAKLKVQPIVRGKPGTPLQVKEIPVMVLRPATPGSNSRVFPNPSHR